MKEIYFIRHGQSIANQMGILAGWTDAPLTDLGVQQAEATRVRLEELLKSEGLSDLSSAFDVIFCSDLKRAVATANPLISVFNQEPIYTQALRELYLGRWENKSFQEIESSEPVLAKQWLEEGLNFTYPEGESLADVVKRATPPIDLARNEFKRILVVAHGGLISGLIAHYVFDNVAMAKGIYVHNAAISRVVFHSSGATLNLLNY